MSSCAPKFDSLFHGGLFVLLTLITHRNVTSSSKHASQRKKAIHPPSENTTPPAPHRSSRKVELKYDSSKGMTDATKTPHAIGRNERANHGEGGVKKKAPKSALK
jgi:hypothetical protein